MSDLILVSYISRKDEILLSESELSMLNQHKRFLSAIFRRDIRFIDLVHSIVSYARTCGLDYDVQLLQARSIVRQCLQYAVFPATPRRQPLYMLLLRSRSKASPKNNDKFWFFNKRSKRSRSTHDLSLIYLDDATLFSCNEED